MMPKNHKTPQKNIRKVGNKNEKGVDTVWEHVRSENVWNYFSEE